MKALLVSFFLFSTAALASGVDVGEISVEGLGEYQGKRITVYYVSGREGFFGTDGQSLKVSKVFKGPLSKTIDRNLINFDATSIQRDGFRVFNYVLVVIHNQETHSLRNIDQTIPDYIDSDDQVPNTPETDAYIFKTYKSHRDLKLNNVIKL